jgi:parvulin-like peptidyl-prolyl isomerase
VRVKSFVAANLVALLVLAGCGSQKPATPETVATANLPPVPKVNQTKENPGMGNPSAQAVHDYEDDVIATVQGDKITRRDLDPVLIEGYGLNVLLTLVQLDLAEQEAARQGLTVTPADVTNERIITMQNLRTATEQVDAMGQPTTEPETISASQEEQLLDQILQQQHVSRAEFNKILQINANLRKIAEPKVQASLTEDKVRAKFDATYGEKAVVHYIQCRDMNEVTEVRRELAAGKTFEDVAKARSLDRLTAPAGGALPPFSRQDMRYPPEIKAVVFDLKVGEVSDPVQHGQFIYLFKLIEKIPPQHAKFEDYKADMKKELFDDTVKVRMKLMRDELAREAMASLLIKDPVLQQQWMNRLNEKNAAAQGENQLRQDLDRQHSTTMPAGAGEMGPAGPGAAVPESEAAPATMPATMP